MDEGVARCAENGDEELGSVLLAGDGMGPGDAIAREVDEELLAAAMLLPHPDREDSRPVAVEVAELAVLVAVWVLALVLLPEEGEGDVLLAELGVDAGPVGKWT